MRTVIKLHIGFDDTDSPRTGCTTYVAALLVDKLLKLGVDFLDYPSLIRLNPNVPWKTRGNGALCLRIKCHEEVLDKIKETVIDVVEANSDLEHEGTDPGIVFFSGEISKDFRDFAVRSIQGIVKMEEALRIIKSDGAEALGFKTGRGIIGSLAAIGETLEGDHTYEIIAYRTLENWGSKRKVGPSSVIEMNEKTAPLTFNNIDTDKGRILITPRGPDPILYGIRGECAEIVKQAHAMVKSCEPIERWMIFRTNQGTDAHLRRLESLNEIKPYNPIIVLGMVTNKPRNIPRRHVIFSLGDKTGQVDCAAYEPTGYLRSVVKSLIVGDVIKAYGGVRSPSSNHPLTINLEKIEIVKLAPEITFHNPLCPQCGRRLESMGKDKGFRCDKCGCRSSKFTKVAVENIRELETDVYIASPRSQRHLTKPCSRYGREKSQAPREMIPEWHSP